MKSATLTVMTFHQTPRATSLCVCYVKGNTGFDAFGGIYAAVVDDFGNVVFVSYE